MFFYYKISTSDSIRVSVKFDAWPCSEKVRRLKGMAESLRTSL